MPRKKPPFTSLLRLGIFSGDVFAKWKWNQQMSTRQVDGVFSELQNCEMGEVFAFFYSINLPNGLLLSCFGWPKIMCKIGIVTTAALMCFCVPKMDLAKPHGRIANHFSLWFGFLRLLPITNWLCSTDVKQ